jgi:hypothetical protein
MIMRAIVSSLLALAILGGIAGRVIAQTSDEISPNDSKRFYEQMDREGRGGQGQGG